MGWAAGTGAGRQGLKPEPRGGGGGVGEGGVSLPLTGCSLQDFSKVDLLIVMGTSLQVQPFASLISK